MKKQPFIFLIAGFVFLFLSVDGTLTGAVTGPSVKITDNLFFVFSQVFFVVSLILFVVNKSLESLVIPTGNFEADQKRLRTAMTDYLDRKGPKPYVLVSGAIQRDERGRAKRNSEQYSIYKELRGRYGLKPSDFIIEGKSKDTLENFLYSVKKLKRKKINRMKIATNPTQYWRFKLFEEEAKREGLVDSSFELEPIYTSESIKEFIYGVLAYVKDYIRIKSAGSLEKARRKKTGSFGSFLKNVLGPLKRRG